MSEAPAVVVVGNVTIDDVVHPDGATAMASLGGNTIHAAAAARIWGVSVGVVARAGTDFPASALARLADTGVDTAGLHVLAGPTVRNWVIYEDDGRRHWVYRTPPGRRLELAPRPTDLPAGWSTGPVVVHVAAMPFDAAVRMVDHLRAAGAATITLDAHEEWDEPDALVALARRVDVFVPSREQLVPLLGHDDAERGCRELLSVGVPAVVVTCGSDGAVLGRVGGDVARVPAPSVRVVDPTGAGDSFAGGLCAGLALGDDLVDAVRRGVATAAAAIGASGSLRLARRAEVAVELLARPADAGRPRPAVATAEPDDSDVMEREITTTPEVIRDRLDLAGQAGPVVERLRDADMRHLVVVGCGDSAFAAQAASLALNKHSGLQVHAEHALDFARYGVRYQPARTAVVVVSFSGQTGRTIEAARQARAHGQLVIALTGAPESPLGQEADVVLSAEIPTFGFSPGTSTYTAMLVTLLTLAASLGDDGPATGEYRRQLEALPGLAEETLRLGREPTATAAEQLVGARITTFLGAGPNEATARFGAAKLFEGAQQLAAVTNVEEWAHEQYFVTRAGDPVVLVVPTGAASDRAAEILSEVNYVDAAPVWVGDTAPPHPALHLPIAAGVAEELSPVLASIPLSQTGLHLMRLNGKRSYNFPDDEARREHYETIHRVTVGRPA